MAVNLPYHPKVYGLNQARAAGNWRESMPTKVLEILFSSNSTMVELSPHHHKGQGLSKATAAWTGSNNMAKRFRNLGQWKQYSGSKLAAAFQSLRFQAGRQAGRQR